MILIVLISVGVLREVASLLPWLEKRFKSPVTDGFCQPKNAQQKPFSGIHRLATGNGSSFIT